jgi:hypothetical protein
MILYGIRRGDLWYAGTIRKGYPRFGSFASCKFYHTKGRAHTATRILTGRYKDAQDGFKVAMDFTDMEIVGFTLTREESECSQVSVKITQLPYHGSTYPKVIPTFSNED